MDCTVTNHDDRTPACGVRIPVRRLNIAKFAGRVRLQHVLSPDSWVVPGSQDILYKGVYHQQRDLAFQLMPKYACQQC